MRALRYVRRKATGLRVRALRNLLTQVRQLRMTAVNAGGSEPLLVIRVLREGSSRFIGTLPGFGLELFEVWISVGNAPESAHQDLVEYQLLKVTRFDRFSVPIGSIICPPEAVGDFIEMTVPVEVKIRWRKEWRATLRFLIHQHRNRVTLTPA